MRDDTTIYADCLRDGKVIRTYDFLCPATLGPSAPPSNEQLISEAKNNLSNERLAAPPFEGITFQVRR
jgi:hypothetical protein